MVLLSRRAHKRYAENNTIDLEKKGRKCTKDMHFVNSAKVLQTNKNPELFNPFFFNFFGPKNLIPLREGSECCPVRAFLWVRLLNSSKEPPGDQPTFFFFPSQL